MDNKIKQIIIFAAGVGLGSLVTWRILRNRYEQYTQEEIDSVKQAYKNKTKNHDEVQVISDGDPKDTESEDICNYEPKEYSSYLKEVSAYSTQTTYTDEDLMDMGEPIVIPPEQFGYIDEYDLIELTYYADNVLTDDRDEPVEDVLFTVGDKALESFGEYEEDSVFVQNDVLKCYFEIVRDLNRFEDISNTPQYLAGIR